MPPEAAGPGQPQRWAGGTSRDGGRAPAAHDAARRPANPLVAVGVEVITPGMRWSVFPHTVFVHVTALGLRLAMTVDLHSTSAGDLLQALSTYLQIAGAVLSHAGLLLDLQHAGPLADHAVQDGDTIHL